MLHQCGFNIKDVVAVEMNLIILDLGKISSKIH